MEQETTSVEITDVFDDSLCVSSHGDGDLVITITEDDNYATVKLDDQAVERLASLMMREHQRRTYWWTVQSNVTALAEWLDFECGGVTPADAMRFFAKPWKWTREYGLFREHERFGVDPATRELRDLLVEAIHDKEKTADQVVSGWYNVKEEEEDEDECIW